MVYLTKKSLMLMCACLAMCAALLLATPALAGGGAPGPGEKDKKEKSDAPARRQNIYQAGFEVAPPAHPYADHIEENNDATPDGVDFRLLAVPAIDEGYLIGYYFISVRLVVANGNSPWPAREAAHALRDGIIRRTHASSLVESTGDDHLSAPVTEAVILQVADEILGEGYCNDVIFFSIDRQI